MPHDLKSWLMPLSEPVLAPRVQLPNHRLAKVENLSTTGAPLYWIFTVRVTGMRPHRCETEDVLFDVLRVVSWRRLSSVVPDHCSSSIWRLRALTVARCSSHVALDGFWQRGDDRSRVLLRKEHRLSWTQLARCPRDLIEMLSRSRRTWLP
jgi:hypothetical protein